MFRTLPVHCGDDWLILYRWIILNIMSADAPPRGSLLLLGRQESMRIESMRWVFGSSHTLGKPHLDPTWHTHKKCGKIPLGLPTCGSHFEELITFPKLSCGKVSHEWSSTMEFSRFYMWQNLVECRWYPTASSAWIRHPCTVGLASSSDHLSKLLAHYIVLVP